METRTKYKVREIVDMATEDLDQLVWFELSQRVGKGNRVSREDLVRFIFGIRIDKSKLANSHFDRVIRESIERLREKRIILSSSGLDGYWLPENEEEALGFIAEMESRAMKILQTTARMKRNIREQFEPACGEVQMGLWG